MNDALAVPHVSRLSDALALRRRTMRCRIAKGKTRGTAHSEIGVNSLHQHGVTSGQTLTTSWRRSTSTLA